MNKSKFIVNLLWTVKIIGVLSGCQQGEKTTISQSSKIVKPLRIPTPASLYCIKKGGTLSMTHTEKKGDIGYCHLPDGRVVEEWTFFKQNKHLQGQ